MKPLEAALKGAQEIGFTVISISISLIAVFIPILLDGRHRGTPLPRVRRHAVHRHRRLARHLADGDADDVRPAPARRTSKTTHGRLSTGRAREASTRSCARYEGSLGWVLQAPAADVPGHARDDGGHDLPLREGAEGLLPAAGRGPAERARSRPTRTPPSRRCRRSSPQFVDTVMRDPGVESVNGFLGGGSANTAGCSSP